MAALFTVPLTRAHRVYLDQLSVGMADDAPKPPDAPGGGAAAELKAAKAAASGGTRNHDAAGRRKRGPFPPGSASQYRVRALPCFGSALAL